jgi:hypothetical protein
MSAKPGAPSWQSEGTKVSKHKLIAVVVLASLACGTGLLAQQKDVTYCELMDDPSRFVGQSIRIRAIYRYGFEVSNLEAPACCERALKIWVELPSDVDRQSKKWLKKLPKGTGVALVMFVGTFQAGESYGTFGERFRLRVNRIERVERVSRSSSRQDNPSWVPSCAKR